MTTKMPPILYACINSDEDVQAMYVASEFIGQLVNEECYIRYDLTISAKDVKKSRDILYDIIRDDISSTVLSKIQEVINLLPKFEIK